MDAQQRQVVGCVTPVISLQKLKDFFVQPKFRSIVPYGPASSLEESRTAAALEASHLHNLYGNHSNRNANNSSPPVSSSSSSSMLVVPQPVSAASKSPGGALNASNTTANGTGRKYQCKMCPQIFGSKADLQLHTQIHMREAKPYKCSQCSKAFANSSYLSQHTRIHLGIKPYRCEICQRKFTQLSHLQQHIRTHTGDKPYKCRHPGCNKAFSQLSNLQSHSRCHQTDKPYKCNSCYKCFSDETSLLEHIPKHKESKHLKTHICQYCGKSYTQETYLAKHMQKHADRIEKRGSQPPVVAHSRMAASSQQVHHQQQHPASSSSAAAAENFWSKAAAAAASSNDAAAMMDRGGDSSSCLQSPSGMDHSRMHPLSARDLEHRSAQGMGGGRISEHHGGGGGGGDMGHAMGQVPYDTVGKTTSAFTPIQTSMLPITSSAQLGMASSSRTYFPYEPISFPKAPQPPPQPMENKVSSFPNQLISLHQIRNYASMPGVGSGEHPISLKDKGHQ